MSSRYRVAEKIGEGGMGEVFLAHDTTLDRRVALKRLPRKLQDDETAKKRFLREAKSAAALDHPFICKIYEIGEDKDGPYIAMEYVRGETLEQRLSIGAVPKDELRRIASEICEALETAHAAGIVHRDLKPYNIMLTEDGHAKVMDFGLAKRETSFERDASSQLTGEGAAVGTIAYMSPEQLRAEPVDARSDIFSFGIVLYEMATGIHPFRKKTSMDTAAAILNETPTPPSSDVDNVLSKILAKEPSRRYQRIREVEAALVPKPQPRSPKPVLAALGVLGAGALALWLVVSSPPEDPPSVAVLPFENVSDDPLESDYLAQGITRAVITKLSQAGIQVSPWETVRRYEGRVPLATELASELNVTSVLMGTFELIDERIVTTLSLVDGTTGLQSWADELEEPFEDIFRVQRRIAMGAATSLKRRLTGEEEAVFAEPESKSVDAYDFYLQGAHVLQEGGEEATSVAFDYFTRAIELDPDLAEAYIGLGGVQMDRYYFGWADQASLDDARVHFERAIFLKPTAMSARSGLCFVHIYLSNSEVCLVQAQEAARFGRPNDVATLLAEARGYGFGGLTEEGLALYRRAIELDPANAEANFMLTVVAIGSQESVESAARYQRRFGDYSELHLWAGHSQFLLGNLERAREHYESAVAGGSISAFLYGGIVHHRLGHTLRAQEVWRSGVERIEPQLELHPGNLRLRLLLAGLYGLLGDRDRMASEEEQALTDDGVVDWTLVQLATVYAALGDDEGAAVRLRRVFEAGCTTWTWPSIAKRALGETPSPAIDAFIVEAEADIERLRELY